MVEILLDQTNENEYKGKNETVKVTTSFYHKSFKQIKYEIQYVKTFAGTIWDWWSNKNLFYIYIKSNEGKKIFEYSPSKENQVVNNVDVYYNTNHLDAPLLLWFKIKYEDKYFLYSKLKAQKSSTGFPSGEVKFRQLLQSLQTEDNRVNRVKFFNTGDNYKNCHKERTDIDGNFIKYCYSSTTGAKRYDDHVLTKDQIFTHETGIDVDASYFSSVNEQYFDSVCVYCTKNDSPRKILLVEFVNDKTKKHFVRQDCYGYHWLQEQLESVDEDRLTQIQNESESKLAFLLNKKDGKYNNNTIEVTKLYEASKRIEIYTHISTESGKNGLLLYNNALISLERPDEYQRENKLTQIQHVCYTSVRVVWTDKHNVNIDKTTPILVELTPSNGSTKYTLQRIDNKGLKWAQTDDKIQNVTSGKVDEIAQKIEFDNKQSIIVKLLQKTKYDIYLIKNNDEGEGDRSDPVKKIEVKNQSVSTDSKYMYYTHDSSESSKLSENENIASLRTYIYNNEIKMYNSSKIKQILKYPPTLDVNKIIMIYFYAGDDVPLTIIYDNAVYIPKNKEDYLKKWILRTDIKYNETTRIIQELNKINKKFNEILLHNTRDGYGISPPPSGQTPSGFDTKRVTVKPESVPGKFGKVTHSTKNGSSIGSIKFEEQELQDDGGKNLSETVLKDPTLTSANIVSVTAYYHSTNSSFNTPLLLSFSKSGTRGVTIVTDVFYERQSASENSRWAKIEHITNLRQNEGLEKKINNIHYNIGKSIVIQVDQQTEQGDSGQYTVQLVQNK